MLHMRLFFRKYFTVVLVIVVVLLSGAVTYFYRKNIASNKDVTKETKALIAEVQAIAVVPENESPTIATVTDPSLLKNQPFFVGAKQGYKVLFYKEAKKAFLYDPKSKKIVNIDPLSTQSQ